MSQQESAPISAPTSRQPLLTLLFFVTPPLLWAGNYIVGRAIRHDIPPVTLTFTRWLVALLIILPFALPHMQRDFRRYLAYPLRILAVSLSGIAAFSILVYYGLHHTSGTNALLLNSCVPVLIMLFSALFFRVRLHAMQVTGLIVSCCGVLTLILQGDPRALLHLQLASGDFFLLAAMASFALYTLWLRKLPAEINRMGLLGMQVIVTLVALSPFFFHEYHSAVTVNWNPKTLAAVVFLGIFPSFIAYLLYGRCVEAVGASRAGLSIHLIPVFGVTLSVLFFGEHIRPFHLLGISIILTGVGLASRQRRARQA